MKAGEFLAQGADTCVYDPHLVCGEFRGDEFFEDPRIPDAVSRVVAANSPEIRIQQILKDTIPSKYKQFFTLYITACDTFLVTKADTQRRRPGRRTTSCSLYALLQHVDTEGVVDRDARLLNLVTPKLGRTLNETLTMESDRVKTKAALYRLLRALLDMEGRYFVYFDGHEKNIGWNRLETELTLFDFGWTRTTPESFMAFCETLQNEEKRNYYGNFKQFHYCMVAFLVFQQRKADLLQLRRIWDVLSIIGTLKILQITSEVIERPDILFPDTDACIQDLVNSVTRPVPADLSELHSILNATIFREEPPALIRTPRILEPPSSLDLSDISADDGEGPCKVT